MSVAALVRFWGDALILHPDLGDPVRAAAWEEALLPALADARAGRWAAALDGLTATLGDPETQRLPASPARADAPTLVASNDGIPIVAAGRWVGAASPEVAGGVRAALAEISRLGRGVLDLRAPTPPSALDGANADLWATLGPRPAERFRVHTGLLSEDRRATGAFSSAWWTRPVEPEPVPKLVVLVNAHSLVPAAVLALRALGRAWIVADAPCNPAFVGATREVYALGGGVSAALRVGELLGEWGIDAVVSGPDPVDAALAVLRQPPSARTGLAVAPKAARIAPGDERPRRDGIVGACRAYALIRRFHPYRAAAPDWDAAFEKVLSELTVGRSERDLSLSLRRLLTGLRDGHASVRSTHDQDVLGPTAPPVRLRAIQGKPVVVALLHPLARALGARVGDEVLAIDGVPAEKRLARLEGLLSAGTPGARRLYALNRLLSGPEGRGVSVRVRGGDGTARDLLLPRDSALFASGNPPERDGAPVRTLAGGVAYLDLDRLTPRALPAALESVRRAPAWLVDGRGQTHETAWLLARYLTPADGLPLARFECRLVAPSILSAGGVLTRSVVERAQRGPWRYGGRVVYLVDERTQSQSELAGLFLRACGAVCVGAPTAGAIGDVTDLFAAEGVRVSFSGQEIRGADGGTVQGVGLPLAERVAETLAGLRAGRDEVLEAGLRRVRR